MKQLHLEFNPDERLLPRQYFWSDFQPSAECYELMEQVAGGIEGIEAIMESHVEHTTFLMVLRPDVNVEDTCELWFKAFRKEVAKVKPEKRNTYVGGISHADTMNAVAVHSHVRHL